MGGHRGGEVASHTAIEALRAAVANGTPLHDAITRANTAVLARAAGDDELTGMGTTLTAVIAIGGRQLLIGHVGDSRAYLLHDGTLHRATDDHSLVEELVREGRLTPEQAESHPQRSIVTRALGVDDRRRRRPVHARGRGRRPRRALLRRPHHDGPRARHRTPRSAAKPTRSTWPTRSSPPRTTAGGEDNTTVVVIDVLEIDPADAGEPTGLDSPHCRAASRDPRRGPP